MAAYSGPANKPNIADERSGMFRPHSASPRPGSVGSLQSLHSNSSSCSGQADRGPRRNEDVCIGEEVKIAINLAIERFRHNESQKELEFPSSLTATERAYIHRLAEDLNMVHKSKGKGSNRYLVVTKKDDSANRCCTSVFYLVRNSRHQIQTLLQRFPVTNKERLELLPRTDKNQVSEVNKELSRTAIGRLNNGLPQVPPKRGNSDLNAFRESLPVHKLNDEIIHVLNNNQVMLVSGETGSGKTTQVPQMILDDCHANSRPCRIFCTQPRRIAALSIAERVAQERGEKVGQTVGYQIRLESRVSPKTLLTFCTNGVLLRTLIGNDHALDTVTHVIVDEVHERDRFSDFLLISLRELLVRQRIKLILMSAALNVELFVRYFNICPIVSVPGSLFSVEEFFLEDILKMTKFTNEKMEKYKREQVKLKKQQEHLNEWCNQPSAFGDAGHDKQTDRSKEITLEEDLEDVNLGEEKEELEPWLVKEMDTLLSDIWMSGNQDHFNQVIHLIMSENISVDYQHSETSATPLMIAAARGFITVVEQLINLGADATLKASNGWSAIDWAVKFKNQDIVDMLEACVAAGDMGNSGDAKVAKEEELLNEEDRELLEVYHNTFDDDKVDLSLIAALIHKIITTQQDGAILVFLPGYDEIVTLRTKISEDRRFDSSRCALYQLHSNMQASDQKRVFRQTPPGVRKIILATNIAETSITINDVVFVIDSGKVKEKTFDALRSVTMLKSNWVSKASALQRKGRAGRCQAGICYHMFSRVRHNNMPDYATPEMLRYPLQELCLHTKLLAPVNTSIADFLSKAPEAPPFLVVRGSVQVLKRMDALDAAEDLTELGRHLADLPVEPRLGKMVLYSIVLKCLDPVLTIVCALAYKDPFQLPAQPYQKREASMAKKAFAAGTFSDHMCLLRAFQAWQRARTDGSEKSFCNDSFISSAAMEMIVGMRAQLLGQLRASGFVRARGGGDIRDLNANSENWAVVKAALCAGMYPNLLRIDRGRMELKTEKDEKVRFHTSSVLCPNNKTMSIAKAHKENLRKLNSDWLLYEEITRVGIYACVRCCTLVSNITVSLFAGPAKLPGDAIKEVSGQDALDFFQDDSDSEGEERDMTQMSTLQLDEWLAFKVDTEAAGLILQLRQKWHSLFIRRMRGPSKPWSQADEAVIRAVVSVLTNEEQLLGMTQPAGIGQRPRPMSAESIMSGASPGRQIDYDEGYMDSNRTKYSPSGRKGNGGPKRKDFPSPNVSGNSSNKASPNMRGSGASTPRGSPQLPVYESSGPCRYFVMKANSQKKLEVSQNRGLWGTNGSNEVRINQAVQSGKPVYLIFSIQGSGHFQGYARVTSPLGKERCQELYAPGQTGTFSVEWIKRGSMPFQETHHIMNAWNDNKRVQISKDGQELEPSAGDLLLQQWNSSPDCQGEGSAGDRKHLSDECPESPFELQFESATMATGSYRGQRYSDLQYYDSYQGQGQYDDYYYGNQRDSSGGYTHGLDQYYHQGNYNQGQGHYNPRNRSQGHRGSNQYHYQGGMQNYGQGFNYRNMGAGINPMYMMQGGGSMSPQQGMSPVMILQRGASQGQQSGYGGQKYNRGYHRQNQK